MKPLESTASLQSPAPPGPEASAARRRIQRLKLLAVLLVCASPVIASYLAYYVFPPMGRTNFGDLIEPQRPVPSLALRGLDGQASDWKPLFGQWVLLQTDSGRCEQTCKDKLHALRQHRTMTGKERDRIERVWLVTDEQPVDAAVLEGHEGLQVLRVPADQLGAWLPTDPGKGLSDYLFVVDPQGNLMMRFVADGEPRRIHKDIVRLLRASRIG